MTRSALALTACMALLAYGAPVLAADSAADVEFFETKIRPVLVEHCYECHAGEKIKGGLRLDSRAGWTVGGDSGPAVVAGKPDDSLLIQAVRYDPSFVQMPPQRKLPENVVKDFEQWVKRGAVDPRVVATPKRAKAGGFDVETARKFWAYRQPVAAAPPTVNDAAWPAGTIDRFILARLEREQLKPVGDASPGVLIRRLFFDLVGLPPSADEVAAFEKDHSSAAYEALVTRLLASPEFGERWARHWLDVARFGESLTLRGFVLDSAWRYRDYCIDVFNQDRPFDQFVVEQIAGDLLPADTIPERQQQRVAVALLALGNTNLEEQDKQQLRMDVVDEQLDTLGKVFLGQTLGCARCHDHKFDPIPTRDYYALAGILRSTHTLHHANVSKWIEKPLPLEPAQEAVYAEQQAKIRKLEKEVEAARRVVKTALAASDPKANEMPDVVSADKLPGVVVDDEQAKAVGAWSVSRYCREYIGSGYRTDDNTGKGTKTLTFQPKIPKQARYEVRLGYTTHSNRATNVPVTIFSADGEFEVKVDMRQPPDILGHFVSLGTYSFEANGQGFVLISTEGTDGFVTPDAVAFVAEQSTETLLKEMRKRQADGMSDDVKTAAADLERCHRALTDATKKGPKPPMVVTVEDERQIEDTRVHVRGNVHSLGESVPRGFLRVATYGPVPEIPSSQSGRLELGRWLASRDNPLTARVIVNRVWNWLLGAGIVRSTDNFGTTGDAPTHPELLDTLAVRFVENGWSIKRLVREIVLSHTYRLSSAADDRDLAADPENRLLWRMNRRRLDAECIRDAMLVVADQLDHGRGGTTVPETLKSDYGYKQTSLRRSIYMPVFRNALPDVLEVFDIADPSIVTGHRNVSTVAPQALFMLNSPWVRERAEHAATRLLDGAAETQSPEATNRLLDLAFRRSLGRSPTAAERASTTAYLKSLPANANPEEWTQAWSIIFQSLFASIDFRYVD